MIASSSEYRQSAVTPCGKAVRHFPAVWSHFCWLIGPKINSRSRCHDIFMSIKFGGTRFKSFRFILQKVADVKYMHTHLLQWHYTLWVCIIFVKLFTLSCMQTKCAWQRERERESEVIRDSVSSGQETIIVAVVWHVYHCSMVSNRLSLTDSWLSAVIWSLAHVTRTCLLVAEIWGNMGQDGTSSSKRSVSITNNHLNSMLYVILRSENR